MSVAEGRHGKVTVVAGSSPAIHTIAELGEWSIGGQDRNMIEYTAFQDTVRKFKPGMLDPGTLTFRGFYDGTDTTGQVKLVNSLSSGGAIDNSTWTTADKLSKLRLWANDDATFESYGFWSCTGSSGEIFITGLEVNQNKDGLSEVTFTGRVSKGALGWSTST